MDYKGQYYKEALLHYGVLGMKWGKRKTRSQRLQEKIKKKLEKAANLEKRAKSENKGYLKEFGRAVLDSYTNPIRSSKYNIKNAIQMLKKGRIIRNKHDLKDMNSMVDMSKAKSLRAKAAKMKTKAGKMKTRSQ